MTAKARITAIDRFIKGLKEDNIYTDLQAACVMAGWDSLAGALTPLKGDAPTNSGFLDADYDRGIGLQGDGSSKYLNSNRNNNADGQNDNHNAAWVAAVGTGVIAASNAGLAGRNYMDIDIPTRSRFASRYSAGEGSVTAEAKSGLYGHSRSVAASYEYFTPQGSGTAVATSQAPDSRNVMLYARTNDGVSFSSFSSANISFYSIGSATDLALLDARVSTLMADLRAIEETGFDSDAIAYIRAVEEADGAYLETDVKIAINNLVAGLKSDGLWGSIGASCLLCGPRTLAGALVPLRGVAPTAEGGWASGDYDRSTGMKGNKTSLYLNTNYQVPESDLNDTHIACHVTLAGSDVHYKMGAYASTPTVNLTALRNAFSSGAFQLENYNNSSVSAVAGSGKGNTTGFYGNSRSDSSSVAARVSGTSYSLSIPSTTTVQMPLFVFASNLNSGTATGKFDGRIAFYSAGTALDVAALDSHVTDYVTAIGAAL